MNIKKDDKVVLSGKDKGKTGKVMIADPKGNKVTVEGVNVATKHQAPKKQGREEGGIIKVDTPGFTPAGAACLFQVRQGYPRQPQGRREDRSRQEKNEERPRLPQMRRRKSEKGADLICLQ